MTAPQSLREVLEAHHHWRLTQTDMDEDGNVSAADYAESELAKQTRAALSAPEAPGDTSAAQLEAAKDVIAFVGPGLLVLRNMLKRVGLPLGETKAQEMIKAVQDFLAGDYWTCVLPGGHSGPCISSDEANKPSARIDALEKALKPFAEEADAWFEMGDTRQVIGKDSPITVGHLRAAKALVGSNT